MIPFIIAAFMVPHSIRLGKDRAGSDSSDGSSDNSVHAIELESVEMKRPPTLIEEFKIVSGGDIVLTA